jgi:hypothetical protein
MKYAYHVHVNNDGKATVSITFDRVLFNHFHSADIMDIISGTPEAVKKFLRGIGSVKGIDACNRVWVEGSRLSFNVCPFMVAKTVERVVKRVQRQFAKGEPRERIPTSEMTAKATALNITREIQARDILVEAAKILPNQDPIRLAAGIKDLNLPPNEALQVLRGLAVHFQGDNADPIRLVAGYNTILGLTPKA